MLTDSLDLKGLLVVRKRVNDGEWVEHARVENLVVNRGKRVVGDLLRGASAGFIRVMAWSDDTAAPLATNTTLPGEDGRKFVLSSSYDTVTNVMNITALLGKLDGNTPGTITKVGFFAGTDATVAANNTFMFNEVVFTAVSKNDSTELQFEYFLTIS